MFEHLSSDCYQLVSAYIFLKGQKPTPKHILKKCLEMLYQAISFFSFFWKQKTSLFSLPCRPYSLFFNHFWSIISLGSHLHCLVVNCKSITKLILNSHFDLTEHSNGKPVNCLFSYCEWCFQDAFRVIKNTSFQGNSSRNIGLSHFLHCFFSACD